MKKWLPWSLLVVSIAFNVFLVAGALVARARARWVRTPEGRVEILAGKLSMDLEQRDAYLKLVRKHEAEKEDARSIRGESYRKVWRELATDEPDERVVADFVRASGASEKRKRFLAYARALMEILRPDQRELVAEAMAEIHRRPRK